MRFIKRKEDRYGTGPKTRQSESATSPEVSGIRRQAALWFIWGAVLFSSCTHLTVAPKPVVAHSIAFDQNQQNAGIIDCDHSGCLVTASFVVKYQQMEKRFSRTFNDDQYIKPEGKNYRMPYSCVEHFTQLKASERGP